MSSCRISYKNKCIFTFYSTFCALSATLHFYINKMVTHINSCLSTQIIKINKMVTHINSCLSTQLIISLAYRHFVLSAANSLYLPQEFLLTFTHRYFNYDY